MKKNKAKYATIKSPKGGVRKSLQRPRSQGDISPNNLLNNMNLTTIFEAKRKTDNGANCTFITNKLFDVDDEDDDEEFKNFVEEGSKIEEDKVDCTHQEPAICMHALQKVKAKAAFARKQKLLAQERQHQATKRQRWDQYREQKIQAVQGFLFHLKEINRIKKWVVLKTQLKILKKYINEINWKKRQERITYMH